MCFMDIDHEAHRSTSSVAEGSTGPEIKFVGVTTTHNGNRALDGVSFTIPAGSITVVMGNPGGGKSLLVQHLLDEERPDEGQVLIDGQSLWELPADRRQRFHERVGVLRGGNSILESELDESATVRENLANQLGNSDRGLGRNTQPTIDECVAELDLGDVVDARPADLEPGDKRRLALAVAVLADPAVVVLDDPGEGIDVNHLSAMVRTITGWHRRTGATVLLTVHSIELARDVGDHLVVLRDGRVIEEGQPRALLADIHQQADFEERFDTTLGFREADPENLRRRNYRLDPKTLALIAIMLIIAIGTIVALLTSGILDIGPQHEGVPDNGTISR